MNSTTPAGGAAVSAAAGCGDGTATDAGLGGGASRVAAAEHDAGAAVGGIPRRRGAQDGFGYSWFCDLYREWVGRLKPTLRQVHTAGERVFVDFAGHTMEVIDGATGEVRRAEIFVAVLGASSYIFAEAAWTSRCRTGLPRTSNMLAFIGGVPRQIVSDNLRAGITRACFYEPLVNRTYADMASHYGTAVIPARPYKPRDKAKVEVGVQVVQRWILARLRNRRFFSLAELNQAIRELVDQLNDRPMRGWGTTRRALYEQLDRPALQPLPPTPYEYADWKRCRVNLDYHVEIDKHFYSVPFRLLRAGGGGAHHGEDGGDLPPRQAGRRPICAACARIGRPRSPSTCRARTGATATGRMNGSCARPPRSATTPRRWSRSSCARARIPSRGSAPASASSGWQKRYDAERLDARLRPGAGARHPLLQLGRGDPEELLRSKKPARDRSAQPVPREHSWPRLLPLKGETMLIHPMAERLRGLGMAAMADAFLEMQNQSAAADLSREDWLGLLLDREVTARDNKRLGRRLRQARLRQNAVVEDTDFRTPRGLDRALFQKLAGCDWIRHSQHW